MFERTCAYNINNNLHILVQKICAMVEIGKLRPDNIKTNFAYDSLKYQLQKIEPLLGDDEYRIVFKAILIDVRRDNQEAWALKYACKETQKRLNRRVELRQKEIDRIVDGIENTNFGQDKF
ncbi:unnamed protein product, partial [Mesorhabditis belari]|uniref:Uncharacterized protein n=1 Tax=Mesorhabditis belari TaxID=2138241 RepID=A0AAF3F4W6_9BILA